ncbi:hypothetical protein [Flavobacterium oreochromis]|uniref:DUF3592 domain-containing protein n=2 Tax=Flavobacterium TaxID=237 RepID=A0A246G725_9FLAO|nr:hypothetical protein [Flavobacterium oreochromis]OWP74079.1 hypothetical protein BWK62_15095 [Flavobacterium oreochromis]OWP74189.1 hypothetical protein BWG23_14660 [Flavobacterium oreochromis]POR17921.1 hypothetical protein BWK58_14870 [Flavobacterium columnare]QYS87046.1 hypothetical protein JJC03_03490 [Flavobacterium oreochromis]
MNTTFKIIIGIIIFSILVAYLYERKEQEYAVSDILISGIGYSFLFIIAYFSTFYTIKDIDTLYSGKIYKATIIKNNPHKAYNIRDHKNRSSEYYETIDYYPVIEFYDNNKVKIIKEAKNSISKKQKIGKTLNIIYDAIKDDFFEINITNIFFFVFILLVSVATLYKSFKIIKNLL